MLLISAVMPVQCSDCTDKFSRAQAVREWGSLLDCVTLRALRVPVKYPVQFIIVKMRLIHCIECGAYEVGLPMSQPQKLLFCCMSFLV